MNFDVPQQASKAEKPKREFRDHTYSDLDPGVMEDFLARREKHLGLSVVEGGKTPLWCYLDPMPWDLLRW